MVTPGHAPTRDTLEVGDTLRITRGVGYTFTATVTEINKDEDTFCVTYSDRDYTLRGRLHDLPYIVRPAGDEGREPYESYHTLTAAGDASSDVDRSLTELRDTARARARLQNQVGAEDNPEHADLLRLECLGLQVRDLWEEVYPDTPFSEDLFTRPLN